jgi:hypothetical protein
MSRDWGSEAASTLSGRNGAMADDVVKDELRSVIEGRGELATRWSRR